MPDAAPTAAGARFRVYIDFDNTISVGDVLDGIIERFAVGDDWRRLEDEWAAGKIGARACLDGQVRTLGGTWADIERHLAGVELDPGFGELRRVLRDAGVDLTILSDNFDRFITAVLVRTGHREVPVFANHVELTPAGVLPSFPHYNPECPGCAHCKKTHFVPRRDPRRIIYVGDGRSDICPATHADIVFAKSSLLRYLRGEKIPCRPFDQLADVAGEIKTLLHEQES